MTAERRTDETRIRDAAAVALPDFNASAGEARELACGIRIGRSAFLDRYGVQSELEYKQQCMRDGHIMYHAHIGMNDITATSAALGNIHRELESQGYRLDRAGFAIDRRMGLPEDMREQAAAETGPMLVQASDWDALAQSAPIQPHLGDFMIGQPASLANTVHALEIGCTTIGNLSQFFTFEAPGWSDTRATAIQTYQAIALLAELRQRGAMLHSYLEDGYGALFRHCSSVAAWAMLEYYIVEELMGARLTHCIGGLTSDPVKRTGWVLALQRIHKGEHVGSMIYGDTISLGREFEKNRALIAEYLQWDIMLQMFSPSGHAVLPLPVTEAIRIPSCEEIIEAQLFGRQVEASAKRLLPHFDFSAAQCFAQTVCQQGQVIYENALTGLAAMGVDVNNPLQLLYLLKKMGAQTFESLFREGLDPAKEMPTDMYCLSQAVVDDYRPMFADPELRNKVEGRRIVVASTDVHQHAAGALSQLLSEAGAVVINLGAEQDPQSLVDAIQAHSAELLMLSTHNGMALDYAKQLKHRLDQASLSVPVIIGGVLNQKVEQHALPVPVIDELVALGMRPAVGLPNLTRLLDFKA